MRHLVFADGNQIAFVHQNVGRLQHGISQKTVGAQVFFFNVLALFFVSRHPFQPAQRRDHRKQQVQLGMLRHVRLDKHGATIRIQSGRQPVQQHFDGILFYLRSVGVIGGERVPVGNTKEAFATCPACAPSCRSAPTKFPKCSLPVGRMPLNTRLGWVREAIRDAPVRC